MLLSCPECNLQISDKALSCPHCGYPMKDNDKKKSTKQRKRRRLPNGFGQISEIKGRNLRKPFRAMVSVGKDEFGRPICKTLKPESYFATYNEAYQALIEYNKNPYDLNASLTLEELYEKWLPEYEKTVSNTNPMTNAWLYCSTVYKMQVADIRARHIKGCIEKGTAVIRGVEKQPNAVIKNRIKILFNLMLDFALEYEIVSQNYARSFNLSTETIKEMKNVAKEHIAFSEEEIGLLWDSVNSIPGVDILLIQCYSGWRPQELCLLETKNIDIENWTFNGGMKTEAGANRTVPIHSKIRELVLQKYSCSIEQDNLYLFTVPNLKNNKPQKLTYRYYKNMFDQIVNQLNLNPNHRPHDGRVHFVTICKKYNVDEYAIKYMVGHQISDITEKIYTKRNFEWLKQEIEKIQ